MAVFRHRRIQELITLLHLISCQACHLWPPYCREMTDVVKRGAQSLHWSSQTETHARMAPDLTAQSNRFRQQHDVFIQLGRCPISRLRGRGVAAHFAMKDGRRCMGHGGGAARHRSIGISLLVLQPPVPAAQNEPLDQCRCVRLPRI